MPLSGLWSGKGGGEERRRRNVCGCVVGGELAGEKGHLQATSFECNSRGPCGGAEGPVGLV